MKKFFLILIIVVGTLTAQASLPPTPSPNGEGSNFTYLTFEMTDGAKVSVPVSSLTITISGTTLTAGSKEFTLSNLKKMYFSNTDQTTGIEEITNDALDEATEIYDLNGRKMGNGEWLDGKLPKGVYIVKTKNKTFKMLVK